MLREKNARPDQALRETEEAAYHAFREWPVLLVLRQKELEARQIVPAPALASPVSPAENEKKEESKP